MIKTTDQLGQELTVPEIPQRIISLVPSITELLCDLGLRTRLVGCTSFCVHPAGLKKSITKVGGTKKLDHDKIIGLKPDLVIANKEENNKEDVHKIKEFCIVWVSDVATVPESFNLISSLGLLFKTESIASKIISKTQKILDNVSASKKRVAYIIWRKPYMTIGGDTYISDVLNRLGYENVFAHRSRYPELNLDLLCAARPEIVFLSSEPFPFKEKHRAELAEYLPEAKIQLIDGEFFSWYGSRMIHRKFYAEQLRNEINEMPK